MSIDILLNLFSYRFLLQNETNQGTLSIASSCSGCASQRSLSCIPGDRSTSSNDVQSISTAFHWLFIFFSIHFQSFQSIFAFCILLPLLCEPSARDASKSACLPSNSWSRALSPGLNLDNLASISPLKPTHLSIILNHFGFKFWRAFARMP